MFFKFVVTSVRLACYGFESFLCIYFLGPVDPAPVKPNSKLCQAVDVIRRCMHQSNYALHDGCVYRKVPESKYTYSYCVTVKVYLLNLLGNVEIADVIAPFLQMLTGLLSEPACRLIAPIKVEYNFIEVQPYGTCFDIERKNFVLDPVMAGSPRAYVKYIYENGKVPRPIKFIEGKLRHYLIVL